LVAGTRRQQKPNGGFYGVTDSGGTDGVGTIFSVND
jgi:hypothetical protein